LVAGSLLARLRGDGLDRPPVDPGLAGGLRDWLEDGLAGPAGDVFDHNLPVRVSKKGLSQVVTCEAQLVADREVPAGVTPELARGSLVDALFRQWVTVGVVEDPVGDALAALAAEGDRDGTVAFVVGLDPGERAGLAAEVTAHTAVVTGGWPVPSPAWLPRTQERLVVPLVGGRIVLSGVVDLALGDPAGESASVCLVEVKSGRRRADLHFYALLETLRSGAPPFRVATYYTGTGELDAEAVPEELLVSALERVLVAASRLCRLASGAEPARSPNPECSWCGALPGCGPGLARVGNPEAR
jgi:hypothetical protein